MIERGVNAQAGGETLLRLSKQICGRLQIEEVRANRLGESDIGHLKSLSGYRLQ